jgi:hypothetical protein
MDGGVSSKFLANLLFPGRDGLSFFCSFPMNDTEDDRNNKHCYRTVYNIAYRHWRTGLSSLCQNYVSYFRFIMNNQRIRPDVDIIMDILQAVLVKEPGNAFVSSLLFQYQERGGLSKKQLVGLLGKARKAGNVPPARLATLEAIIRKRATRDRSPLPQSTPLYNKDEQAGQLIDQILQKFPAHKRVLFLQSKYQNNEELSAAEKTELEKFGRLLLNK